MDFIKSTINAIKAWVRYDAFTADDALEIVIEENIVEPLAESDGSIYTSPTGEIYIIN